MNSSLITQVIWYGKKRPNLQKFISSAFNFGRPLAMQDATYLVSGSVSSLIKHDH